MIENANLPGDAVPVPVPDGRPVVVRVNPAPVVEAVLLHHARRGHWYGYDLALVTPTPDDLHSYRLAIWARTGDGAEGLVADVALSLVPNEAEVRDTVRRALDALHQRVDADAGWAQIRSTMI